MKIVIFTGGTGSTELQKGLNYIYGENLDLHLVTNAYDNGMSTGLVRKVADGKILGPSDLRKNQFLQAKLYLENFSKKEDTVFYKKLITFLEERISKESIENVCDYIRNRLDDIFYSSTDNQLKIKICIESAISTFFAMHLSKKIDYIDFSIANILYTGLAIQNGYSLKNAGIEMAKKILPGIQPNRVVLSSDENLYLTAVTQSGRMIMDEGDIVKWNDSFNPIVDIKLVDENGIEKIPELDLEVRKLMLDADIIIFSCGTQWSSLIPTYKHKFFKETIEAAKAKLYLVMNNVPDKDMIGGTSTDILEIVKNYLPYKRISVILNPNADNRMIHPHMLYERYLIDMPLSEKNKSTHDGIILAYRILSDYFSEYLNKELQVFDFDGTIVGRGNTMMEESDKNLEIILRNPSISILSGNSFNRIETRIKKISVPFMNYIYCDGGNSHYGWDIDTNMYVFTGYLDKTMVLSIEQIKKIYEFLAKNGIKFHLIENRNNMIVSVKPVDIQLRPSLIEKLNMEFGSELKSLATGRSTIDIMKKEYDKSVIFKDDDMNNKSMLYVGDELEHGNDSIMKHNHNVKYYSVKDPKDTWFLLKFLDTRFIRIMENTINYLKDEKTLIH